MKDIYAFEPIWENWVIDEFLGSGSYGSVYKAHREDQFSHVKQYAAVKHISIPKQDGNGENDIPFPSEEAKSQYYRNMLNQLIIEIDAMISLRGKPNIVSYEEHKVVPKERNSGYDLFLRMELLKSVPKYIEEIKRPLTRQEVIQLGIDIATALETLENRNLVHRDIKPDNIFIDDEGHFKLGDFGTARVLEVTGNASTKTGTPNYMAPEVYTRLVRYDQTVDIYSLGIMLYRYMNDGYLPFMSATALDTDVALTRRIRGESIDPPCNADEELSRIILKACAYKAEDRYQNAQDLKRDLIKCKEQRISEVNIPIVCLMDDGQELFRGHKKAQTGSRVIVTTDDIPYRKFVGEDKELIGSREIAISIDENGRINPSEAVFTLIDCKTLFAVNVDIICLDENDNEILVQKTQCFYQNRNVVKAPSIAGYKPFDQTEIEVEVLKNQTSRPPQVIFHYQKEVASDFMRPAECDVPILCVLENGEEILSSKRNCRENVSNIVTAPEITGYVLIGDDSKKISVSHNGNAEPDKVIFTYRRIEKKETTVSIICRDDYGNELKRDSVAVKAGQTLNLTAPVIDRFKLINGDKNTVVLYADDKGVPSQNEVLFIYQKKKGSGQNKKRLGIISVVVVLLLVAAGIAIWQKWIPGGPISKYTITWKNDNGSVLEIDNEVAFASIPEYNGLTPLKPEDDKYMYIFMGWTPNIEPVKADKEYVAVFDKEKKEVPTDTPELTDTPTPEPTDTPTPEPTEAPVIKEGEMINRYAITSEGELKFRGQPRGQVLETIRKKGTYVWLIRSDVDDKGDSWSCVQYNGKTGYIMTKYLNLLTQEDSDAWNNEQASPAPIYSAEDLQPTEAPTATPSKELLPGDSTWNCSNCSSVNSINNQFCTNCGKTRLCIECGACVPIEDKYCSNCSIELGHWKCSNCGTACKYEDLFCENCATKRHEPGVSESSRNNTQNLVHSSSSVAVGDIIAFGTYPQTVEGTDQTPIEWIVLDYDEVNHKALLLSKYGLDTMPYNEKMKDITWSKCTLRIWLNGEFLNEAFNSDEKSAILTAEVDNSAEQGYNGWSSDSGNNTQDRIFLLSYAEANYYLVVTWDGHENTRSRTAPTAYAIARGANTNITKQTEDGEPAGWWWLRSSGRDWDEATAVLCDGSLGSSSVENDSYVVRPAFWLNLDSAIL